MNLLCFTLNGSAESVYDPPYSPTPKEVLPKNQSSPSLLRAKAEWVSNSSILSSSSKLNRDSRSSLAAASDLDIESLAPSQSSTLRRRDNVKELKTQTGSPAQGSDSQSEVSVLTQSSRRLKKLHNLAKETKKAQRSGAERREITHEDHWSDAVSSNSMLTCIGLGRRTEKKAIKPDNAPAPVEAASGHHEESGVELYWNLSVGNPPWSSSHCPQAWTPLYPTFHYPQHEMWTCGATMSLPRKIEWDRFESLIQEMDCKHSVPQMIRSITDLQLSQNRLTRFGRSEACRDRSSLAKQQDNDCCLNKQAWNNEMTKSILQRREITMSSQEDEKNMEVSLVDSPTAPIGREEGKAGAERIETHGGRPFSRGHRRSSKSVESLFSLNSGQSSSSGVTSESDCSSNRNSLRLEDDLLYTKHFCGRARVHTEYVPSPYDTESLTLKVGDILDIIAKPPMGIWKGVLRGRIGSFKFIYVDLLTEENLATTLLEVRQKSTVQEVLKRLSLEEYALSLQLNGYQTVDDLMRLREHHLLKLKVTHPEHRQRLLAAVYSLQQLHSDPQLQNDASREEKESTKGNTNNCPRDSGCHMSSESTDMFPEDAEPHFTSSDHPLSAVLKALQQ